MEPREALTDSNFAQTIPGREALRPGAFPTLIPERSPLIPPKLVPLGAFPLTGAPLASEGGILAEAPASNPFFDSPFLRRFDDFSESSLPDLPVSAPAPPAPPPLPLVGRQPETSPPQETAQTRPPQNGDGREPNGQVGVTPTATRAADPPGTLPPLTQPPQATAARDLPPLSEPPTTTPPALPPLTEPPSATAARELPPLESPEPVGPSADGGPSGAPVLVEPVPAWSAPEPVGPVFVPSGVFPVLDDSDLDTLPLDALAEAVAQASADALDGLNFPEADAAVSPVPALEAMDALFASTETEETSPTDSPETTVTAEEEEPSVLPSAAIATVAGPTDPAVLSPIAAVEQPESLRAALGDLPASTPAIERPVADDLQAERPAVESFPVPVGVPAIPFSALAPSDNAAPALTAESTAETTTPDEAIGESLPPTPEPSAQTEALPVPAAVLPVPPAVLPPLDNLGDGVLSEVETQSEQAPLVPTLPEIAAAVGGSELPRPDVTVAALPVAEGAEPEDTVFSRSMAEGAQPGEGFPREPTDAVIEPGETVPAAPTAEVPEEANAIAGPTAADEPGATIPVAMVTEDTESDESVPVAPATEGLELGEIRVPPAILQRPEANQEQPPAAVPEFVPSGQMPALEDLSPVEQTPVSVPAEEQTGEPEPEADAVVPPEPVSAVLPEERVQPTDGIPFLRSEVEAQTPGDGDASVPVTPTVDAENASNPSNEPPALLTALADSAPQMPPVPGPIETEALTANTAPLTLPGVEGDLPPAVVPDDVRPEPETDQPVLTEAVAPTVPALAAELAVFDPAPPSEPGETADLNAPFGETEGGASVVRPRAAIDPPQQDTIAPSALEGLEGALAPPPPSESLLPSTNEPQATGETAPAPPEVSDEPMALVAELGRDVPSVPRFGAELPEGLPLRPEGETPDLLSADGQVAAAAEPLGGEVAEAASPLASVDTGAGETPTVSLPSEEAASPAELVGVLADRVIDLIAQIPLPGVAESPTADLTPTTESPLEPGASGQPLLGAQPPGAPADQPPDSETVTPTPVLSSEQPTTETDEERPPATPVARLAALQVEMARLRGQPTIDPEITPEHEAVAERLFGGVPQTEPPVESLGALLAEEPHLALPVLGEALPPLPDAPQPPQAQSALPDNDDGAPFGGQSGALPDDESPLLGSFSEPVFPAADALSPATPPLLGRLDEPVIPAADALSAATPLAAAQAAISPEIALELLPGTPLSPVAPSPADAFSLTAHVFETLGLQVVPEEANTAASAPPAFPPLQYQTPAFPPTDESTAPPPGLPVSAPLLEEILQQAPEPQNRELPEQTAAQEESTAPEQAIPVVDTVPEQAGVPLEAFLAGQFVEAAPLSVPGSQPEVEDAPIPAALSALLQQVLVEGPPQYGLAAAAFAGLTGGSPAESLVVPAPDLLPVGGGTSALNWAPDQPLVFVTSGGGAPPTTPPTTPLPGVPMPIAEESTAIPADPLAMLEESMALSANPMALPGEPSSFVNSPAGESAVIGEMGLLLPIFGDASELMSEGVIAPAPAGYPSSPLTFVTRAPAAVAAAQPATVPPTEPREGEGIRELLQFGIVPEYVPGEEPTGDPTTFAPPFYEEASEGESPTEQSPTYFFAPPTPADEPMGDLGDDGVYVPEQPVEERFGEDATEQSPIDNQSEAASLEQLANQIFRLVLNRITYYNDLHHNGRDPLF